MTCAAVRWSSRWSSDGSPCWEPEPTDPRAAARVMALLMCSCHLRRVRYSKREGGVSTLPASALLQLKKLLAKETDGLRDTPSVLLNVCLQTFEFLAHRGNDQVSLDAGVAAVLLLHRAHPFRRCPRCCVSQHGGDCQLDPGVLVYPRYLAADDADLYDVVPRRGPRRAGLGVACMVARVIVPNPVVRAVRVFTRRLDLSALSGAVWRRFVRAVRVLLSAYGSTGCAQHRPSGCSVQPHR